MNNMAKIPLVLIGVCALAFSLYGAKSFIESSSASPHKLITLTCNGVMSTVTSAPLSVHDEPVRIDLTDNEIFFQGHSAPIKYDGAGLVSFSRQEQSWHMYGQLNGDTATIAIDDKDAPTDGKIWTLTFETTPGSGAEK
jgi:hypothetical protein